MLLSTLDAHTQVLRECRLFRDLPAEDIRTIAKTGERRTVRPRAEVFQEGAPPAALSILADGTVELLHLRARGDAQLVGFRTPISPLGLGAVVQKTPFLMSARALDAVTVLRLPAPVVQAVLVAYPEVQSRVVAELHRDLRERDVTAAATLFRTAQERIACAVLRLARQFGVASDEGIRLSQPIKREEIAAMVGVSVETCIRVMSALEKRAVVTTQAQHITLRHPAALRATAMCDTCQLDCSVVEPAKQDTTAPASAAGVEQAPSRRTNGHGGGGDDPGVGDSSGAVRNDGRAAPRRGRSCTASRPAGSPPRA